MISGEQSVDVDADIDELWEYMSHFENWAPHVIGFQKLEVVDDIRSIWTLRGDVGILAREVDIQVDLGEQVPGERAEFTLTGLTEKISGTGSFRMRPLGTGDDADEAAQDAPSSTTNSSKRWQRGLYNVVSRGMRSSSSEQEASSTTAATSTVTENDELEPRGKSRLTFKLEVSPGGPMAPMLEVLMAPMLKPAADDICERVRLDLRGSYGN